MPCQVRSIQVSGSAPDSITDLSIADTWMSSWVFVKMRLLTVESGERIPQSCECSLSLKRYYAVAEGTKSVHPIGSPISISTQVGFKSPTGLAGSLFAARPKRPLVGTSWSPVFPSL